ncbi:MAG: BLUF domain-containing protein [Brevundimonas sp.]|nr:MAG: BLUF domain-containing protein [Brevundimonas sp.]
MLEEIVYASTATGSTTSLLNMATLLGEAQRNNARAGLTGALAAHDDRFFQVIEGHGQVLDGLLRRLANDPRHRDIRIIGRRPIDQRSFADWTMANATVTPRQGAELDALTQAEAPSAVRVVGLLRQALEKGAATAP